jgi:hypothetical protein
MVTLGGQDDRAVQLAVAILGCSLYLTFHRLLPKRWAIGWFKRGEVQNPRWFEDSHGRDWGFYSYKDTFVWHWGHTCAASGSDKKKYGYSKHFHFPWDWGASVRHVVLTADGKWNMSTYEQRCQAIRKERKKNPKVGYFDFKDEDFPDHRAIFLGNYTYTLKSGEIQYRKVKFHIEEREWRWKIFHKLPFRFGPKKVERSISVEFDQEVGEETGSWKGGATGCGYEMLPGETGFECLRRMERERKF